MYPAAWTKSDDGLAIQVRCCRSCGTAGVLWTQADEDRRKFFAAYSYSQESAWQMSPASQYSLEAWIRSLEPYRKLNRWLDVGCGAGGLLEVASAMGWDAEGTELSTVAAERLRNKGLDIHVGFLPELEIENDGYDVVSMTELLEHIKDPGQDIAKAYAILRQGGVLFLTTPNYASLKRRCFGPMEVLIPPDHLWSFSRTGLERLLGRAGFKQVKVWSEGLNPYRFLVLKSQKELSLQPRISREQTQALQPAAHQKGSWRAVKSIVNWTMRVGNLGDTLKAHAVK